MFSVDTEEEAERLLRYVCPTNLAGEFVAPELVEEQTLENLQKFSDKLAGAYEFLNERSKNGKRAVPR